MFEYIVTGSKGYIGSRLADMLLEKQKDGWKKDQQ